LLARISSATGGGKYAWFDAPNCGRGVAVIDAAPNEAGKGRDTFAEAGDDGDGEESGDDEEDVTEEESDGGQDHCDEAGDAVFCGAVQGDGVDGV
jgi:hypothetical protein